MNDLGRKYLSIDDLTSTVHQLINDLHYSQLSAEQRREAEHYFIEALIFADSEKIIEMLDVVDEEYWLEFPVWARLLAYRLVCLLKPNDVAFRVRAANGLMAFGPDWDNEAERLRLEAENLSSKGLTED